MSYRRLIPALILIVMVALMSKELMDRQQQELLWGWRPLAILLGGWVALLLLGWSKFSRIPANHRMLSLSCLSGALLSLGFPPSPITPLIFVGFVPLLIISNELIQSFGKAARWQMWKYAFNAFFIWNICTTWWVLNTSFMPGIVANVANAVIMATFFTLFHQVSAILRGRLVIMAWVAIWITFEYIHLFWEISWPWLNLGHAFAQYPSWVQWYEYTGVFGGSLWVLLVNFWLFDAHRSLGQKGFWPKRRMLSILAVILLPVVCGVIRWATYPLPEGTVEVVVVQPNFEPHFEKFHIKQAEQLDRFIELSRGAMTQNTEYLVFPETSFSPVLLNDIEDDYRIRSLRQFAKPHPRLKIVTGLESYRSHPGMNDLQSLRVLPRATDTLFFDVQNSAVQLLVDEEIDPYFKSKLVPGAELFPFKKVLFFIKPLIRMLQGSVAGLTTQEHREVFTSDVATVAPVICYESIYGGYVGQYVRLGADIIFVVTNDGWWDDSPGHVQHLKFATLRAIEHRRSIARSANTGVSCFINARGDILQATNYNEATAINGKIAPGKKFTFYTKWGDVIARISLLVSGFLVLLTLARSLNPSLEVGKSGID